MIRGCHTHWSASSLDTYEVIWISSQYISPAINPTFTKLIYPIFHDNMSERRWFNNSTRWLCNICPSPVVSAGVVIILGVIQMLEVWINEGLLYILYEIRIGQRGDEGILFLALPAGSVRGECLGHMCENVWLKSLHPYKKTIDFSSEANLSQRFD